MWVESWFVGCVNHKSSEIRSQRIQVLKHKEIVQRYFSHSLINSVFGCAVLSNLPLSQRHLTVSSHQSLTPAVWMTQRKGSSPYSPSMRCDRLVALRADHCQAKSPLVMIPYNYKKVTRLWGLRREVFLLFPTLKLRAKCLSCFVLFVFSKENQNHTCTPPSLGYTDLGLRTHITREALQRLQENY